jgi:mono/diheme cytochrome c family protein
MKPPWQAMVLLALLGLGLGLAAVWFWRAPAGGRPVVIPETAVPPVPTLDPARVEHGAALYAQHCARCHGASLEGQPNWKQRRPDGSLPAPPHDDSGHTWHHPDALLTDLIARGGAAVYNDPAIHSTMPAFGDKLAAEDIAAILDFIKSRWGQAAREFQWWMTVTSTRP